MSIKFKMIGRDINSPVKQYRTWTVFVEPDYKAQYYAGLKSGTSKLVDIVAYQMVDPVDYGSPTTYYFDFNFPDGENWETTKRTLPEHLYDSQVAVIDQDIYLFGGAGSGKILKAPINNPTEWVDTGATLPAPLSGSQLAIVDNNIYLFGGIDQNGNSTSVIYTASIFDPYTWNNYGLTLPAPLSYSQLAIIDGYIYLFGGKTVKATDVIYRADILSPLIWTDTGGTLSEPVYGSQLCIMNSFDPQVYLIGGLDINDEAIDYSFRTSSSDPVNGWTFGVDLPRPVAFGQLVFIGLYIYYVGGYGSGSGVLRAYLQDYPDLTVVDLGDKLPATSTHSQAVIIYDRVFLLGGNGSTVIFECKNEVKYPIDVDTFNLIRYGYVSKPLYDSTTTMDLFKAIGFCPWKCDYGSY